MNPADDSNDSAPPRCQASAGQSRIPDALEAASLPERVKLQAVLGIECVVPILVLTAFFAIIIGSALGPSSRRSGLISQRTTTKVVASGAGLLAVAGLIWLGFDNHYVLDRRGRRILIHKGVRFSGQAKPFCEAHEIRGMALKAVPRNHKGRQTGWEYTPLLLLKGGEDVALSSWSDNMSGTKLPGYNLTIRQWAAALQCEFIECPREREFDPRSELGHTGPA